MNEKTQQLEWKDGGVPISTRFDDPYYSLDNGLAETQHVFLKGNDLPERFCDGFHIAELGFGTGLNLLATLQAFEASRIEGKLVFTSFEAYPLQTKDIAKALAPFSELNSAPLISMFERGAHMLETDNLQFTLIVGDARKTLPNWEHSAHAWFLDGFSPAKNPELWEAALMTEVATHTKQGGTFATYTAAGDVRRALASAGFDVERVPGFGRKRHMSRGILT